ncbi:hypothetical protein BY457_11552 [Marinilabilia salmonicolor]|nr:hypothetical protein BY457_11552 [Marinilabilia salmonicolor]
MVFILNGWITIRWHKGKKIIAGGNQAFGPGGSLSL